MPFQSGPMYVFVREQERLRDGGGREKWEEKRDGVVLLAALFMRLLDSQGNWLKSY